MRLGPRAWLQGVVNDLDREQTPWEPGPLEKKSGGLILEADDLSSAAGSWRDVWWAWVALDAETRQFLAMMIGGRSESTARCL